MILLIDNYDSFVYNLYQFIAEIEPDVKVVRNDEITSEEILKMNPDKIVISPVRENRLRRENVSM